MTCHHCGKIFESQSNIGLREECVGCGRDLHACLNCKHYDAGSYNECREPVAERVVDKEKANFCDHYAPNGAGGGSKRPSSQDLRAAAEALFKKKG